MMFAQRRLRLTLLGSALLAAVALYSAPGSAAQLGSAPPRAYAPALGRFVAPADRGVAADVPYANDVRDFGRMRANQPVQIGLLLRVRNEAELKQLILEQGDRRSRYYHHFLTPAQFNEYFAPSAETYAHTVALLERRGFRVTQTLRNRAMIRAVGPAATVERYFTTELHSVYQQKHGVRYVNVRPALMPAELRDVAVSVAGLHSIVMMHFPIEFANKAAIRQSASYELALARRAQGKRLRPHLATTHPIGMNTPAPPGPDPTESPEDPDTDYLNYYGYGPPIYATGYDYPVEHGYGGSGQAAGSVINSDYLDSDETKEAATFNIHRTGTTNKFGYRVCTDPNATANCDGIAGQPDPEGESTLDAITILSLAPQADFYEYLAPDLNDIGIEFAYERAVNDDIVETLNSSFGSCETSDPAFEYSSNYIAMEGAALGITFSASSGDNGATECGLYASNGTPTTEIDVLSPSSDEYFVSVGGTSYLAITPLNTNDYDKEQAWEYGGGGHSVYEPIPSWQQALVGQSSLAADASTLFRNMPDVAMCADPGTNPDGFVGGVDGVSEVITDNGNLTAAGGTSLASPMFVAMQTDIDQVENSRNGLVTPSLYAIAATSSAEYAFAFHDITIGANNFYTAETGYDLTTGIGSPLGWELAGAAEYGQTPVAPKQLPTPGPSPSAAPTPVGAKPSPSPTPVSTATPHQSGTNFVVATIAGAACAAAGSSFDSTSGNTACFANPTGIVYVAASATGLDTQSETDNFLFVNDFATGFLRGQDLTSSAVVTYENRQWNNATRAAAGSQQSQLYGLAYLPETGAEGAFWGDLYVVSGGDNTTSRIALPTTPDPAATPASVFKNLTGGAAAETWDAAGEDLATVSATGDTLMIATFATAEGLDLTSSTTLPTKGNFGITVDGAATAPSYAITDSGLNEVLTATDVPGSPGEVNTSTIAVLATGSPLSNPKQITYLSSTNAFYVANCGGNNIIRISSAGAMTVAAGYGAPAEKDGDNTGAGFDCPWGITNDGTNLYVTDQAGGTIRMITNVI